jgi:hypothetical protein
VFCKECNLNKVTLSASRTVKVPVAISDEDLCICKLKNGELLAATGLHGSVDEIGQWYIGPVDG